MSTPKIDIYSKFSCPFCVRAKRLLSSKGAEFNEYDITMGGPKREEMLQRAPNAMTVPQILSATPMWVDRMSLQHWNAMGSWTRF